MLISVNPGDLFDTPYEKGCRAIESPDQFGNFLAIDSDGVVCNFSEPMVTINYVADPSKEGVRIWDRRP